MKNSHPADIQVFSQVCPKCGAKRQEKDERCPACGIYYFKCEQKQHAAHQQEPQYQESISPGANNNFMEPLRSRLGEDLYELLFCPSSVGTLGCYIRAYIYLSLFVSGLYWIGFDYRSGELPPYFIGYVLEVFAWTAQGPFTPGSFGHAFAGAAAQLFVSLAICGFMLFRKNDPLMASFGFWLLAVAVLNQVPPLYQQSHGMGFLLHKLGALFVFAALAWGGVLIYRQFGALYFQKVEVHPEQEQMPQPATQAKLVLEAPEACPKCGAANQDKEEQCAQCGLYFMKWAQTQQAARMRVLSRKEQKPSLIYRVCKKSMEIFRPANLFTPKENLSSRRLIQQILATCMILYLSTLMIGYDYSKGEMNWFLHTVIFMPVHEGGHAFFMFICPGTFLHSLGGMLGQTLLFLLFGVFFLARKRDPWLSALFLWLCGTGLLDTAPYIYDALVPQLPLLGGREPGSAGHDWIAMLGQFEMIDRAPFIASCVYKIGAGLTLLALSWMFFLLYKQIGLPLNDIEMLLEDTKKSWLDELKQTILRRK